MKRLVAAVLGAAVLAGCGSSPSAEPQARLENALDKVDASGSFRSAFRVVSSVGVAWALDGTMLSSADGERVRSRATISLEDREPREIELLGIGDDEFYARRIGARMPPGKRWIGGQQDPIQQRSLTPAAFADMLRQTRKVEATGRRADFGDVIGEQLRMRVELDEDTEAGGTLAREITRNPEILERAEADAVVWVGERDDRLLRLELVLRVDGVPGEIEYELDILERDVPLDRASAPPADSVVTQPEIGVRG